MLLQSPGNPSVLGIAPGSTGDGHSRESTGSVGISREPLKGLGFRV